MLSYLYDIVVTPLVYAISFVFSLVYGVAGSPGIAILGVSLFVNLLCLPLYGMADAAQRRERDKQLGMQHWVDHIRKHFSGDEQYLMLSTYYRQQGYKPIQALTGTLTLLLQIPFFIAAYRYLSGLELLRSSSFLFLADLGSPDGLLSLGGMQVNVMPIVMTALNVVSTLFYTKGLALRDKLQSYGLALLFLFLLYDSPSGLVLYWTCNQIFSLAKNVLALLPHRRLATAAIVELASGGLIWWLLSEGIAYNTKRKLLLGVAFALVQLALVVPALVGSRGRDDHGRRPQHLKRSTRKATTDLGAPALFLGSACLLALTCGVLVPAALVGAAPNEFMSVADFVSPLTYLAHTTCVSVGIFVLWLGVFFFLAGPGARRVMAALVCAAAVLALVNYYTYGTDFGVISESLVYEDLPSWPLQSQLVNLALGAGVCLACVLVAWKLPQVARSAMLIGCVVVVAASVPNLRAIKQASDETEQKAIARAEGRNRSYYAEAAEDGSPIPFYQLSRSGKNVIVLFLDRGISAYLPYIMNERPELEASFDGFVYYPNTISHGIYTVFGSPAIYGGYEYTPSAINARDDQTVFEKEVEAFEMLPTVFAQAGYESTIVNPPLGKVDGEMKTDDGQMPAAALGTYCDETDNLSLYYTQGAFTSEEEQSQSRIAEENLRRSFVFYSLLKVAPAWLQPIIYDEGTWQSTLVNHAHSLTFMHAYTELTLMDQMVDITDEECNNFLLMRNKMTHSPEELQLPGYKPMLYLHNEGLLDLSYYTLGNKTLHMDTERQVTHYQCNLSALLLLGQWFDYLREEGVYDNTRIIIVSDHGRELGQVDELLVADGVDAQGVNPLFMVKDFDAHGFETSDEFMTNADTPAIATAGLIKDATNPFTGKKITSDAKSEPQQITFSHHWESDYHLGTSFGTDDGPWYTVQNDIFDPGSWKLLQPASEER